MTLPRTQGMRGIPTVGLSTGIAASTREERRELQLSIARHDAPMILALSGLLLVGYSTIAYLVDPSGGLVAHAADVPAGIVLIAAGILVHRLAIANRFVPWIIAAMALLVVLALLVEVWRAPAPLAAAYVLLIVCAFGPPTLSWGPFLSTAPVMIVAIGIVTRSWLPTEWIDWMAAGIVAALIGAMMLGVRLRSVNALADATAEVRRLAVTDSLTGLLNRHGMTLQVPQMVANATRYRQPMFVAFIDIDGLKQANDRFGHEFGDAVISCVANAVTNSVRDGDLIARWGGDELIVAGVGNAPLDDALSSRLGAWIAHSGIDLAKWPGTVSLGFAESDPGEIDFDRLIADADTDMYRRRLTR